MIVNLTPHTVDLYRREDVVPDFGKGFKLAHADAVPAYVIPSSGIARVATCERVDGEIAGIPVLKQEFGAVEGLPAPSKGIYYIVSVITASAAREAGRTTSDLLLTTRLVRDERGAIIGCAALARP